MSDIVNRLRSGFLSPTCALDAADEIARLRAERDELRAELTLKEAVGNELNHAIANNCALNKYIDELLAELNGCKNGTEAKNI